MKYPNKLKHFRTKNKLTQQQVVRILGLESTSRLSDWEQGKTMPNLPNLFKLCQLYGVTSENIYSSLNMNPVQRRGMAGRMLESDYSNQFPDMPPDSATDEGVQASLRYLADLIVEAYMDKKRGKENNL